MIYFVVYKLALIFIDLDFNIKEFVGFNLIFRKLIVLGFFGEGLRILIITKNTDFDLIENFAWKSNDKLDLVD